VPDTGTGTRAGYHATDPHGFLCTSLSLDANSLLGRYSHLCKYRKVSDNGRSPIYPYEDQKLIQIDRRSQVTQMKQLAARFSSPRKGHSTRHFSAHVYCGEMAGWIKMPRDTSVVTVSKCFLSVSFGRFCRKKPRFSVRFRFS